MKKTTLSSDQGLDDLFEKYQKAPDSYVFVPLADACRKIGRFDEALEICEKGVGQHPNYASGHVVKGKCLYDKGDFDAACETFERVLDIDDNNLVALKFLGMIAADDGHLDTARSYFQKILAVDPDNKDITRILRDVEVREQTEGTEEVLVAAAPDVASDECPTEDAAVTSGDPDEPGESTELVGSVEPADASEPADSKEFSDPNEITISNKPTDSGEPENSTDSVETSEELASITLADIFASQGYTSKAEKIYREVLKKQPSNDAVRKKLEALSPAPEDEVDGGGGSGDTKGAGDGRRNADDTGDGYRDSDAGGNRAAHDDDSQAGTRDIPVEDDATTDELDEVSEFVELTDDTDSTRQHDSTERSQNAAEPETGSEMADSSPKAKNGGTDPTDEEDRPAIEESDSMSHFRQWLKQMQK